MKNSNYLKKHFWAVLLGCLCLLVSAVSVKVKNNVSHNTYGDSHTLMNVMYASKVFSEKGFIGSSMTPLIPKPVAGVCCSEEFYTHFTPLPYYFGGLVWKLGYKDIGSFRIIPIIVAILFLIFFYLTMNQYFSAAESFWLVFFLISSYVFWANQLTQIMNFASLFFIINFFLVIKFCKGQKLSNEKFHILLIVLTAFLNFFSTFEMIFFGQVVVSGFLLLFYRENFWKLSFAVGCGYIIAFLLKLLFTSWALGGIAPTILDLKKAFLWRTAEFGGSTNYFEKLAGGFSGYPSYLWRNLSRHFQLDEFQLSMALLMAVLLNVKQIGSKVNTKIFFAFCGLFFLGAFSWALIFPQHNVIHINSLTNRHWLMAYSLFVGGLILGGFRRFFHNGKFGKIVGLASVLIGLSIVFNNVKQTKGFLINAENSTWTKKLSEFRTIISDIPASSFIYTDSRVFAKIHFLHMPYESFELKPLMVKFASSEVIEESEVCPRSECYFVGEDKAKGSWTLQKL